MKMRKLSVVTLCFLTCIMAASGCARALRDGVSIGVTDGLSNGIAVFVADLIGSASGGGA